MRRRRKPGVVWLPPDAYNRIGISPAGAGYSPGSFQFVVQILGPGVTPGVHSTGLIALVADLPTEFQGSGVAVNTLSDIYSSGYRLRRIVGKLFVSLDQTPIDTDIPEVQVTAGIIVLRVDSAGVPIAGTTTLDTSYSPAIINSWADPWIWRRSWMMSNYTSAMAINRALWGETNSQVAGVLDGPHVDAKTARRVGNEERLFLVVDLMVTAATAATTGDATIRVSGDLRFVASMLRQAGNRRNASR